jgi:Putative zinc-finger
MDQSSSDLHQLLPWFVNGTLDPVEARAFKDHLDACGACSEEMELWSSMLPEIERHGEAFFASHPEPEAIVAAARGSRPEGAASEIRRHLALCSTCTTEARLARDDGSAIGKAAPGSRRLPALGSDGRAGRYLPWLVAAAALIVAAIGLHQAISRTGTRLVPAFFVEAQDRASDIGAILLPRRSDLFQIVLPVDVEPGSYPLTIEISDSHGRVIFRQEGIASAYRDRFLFIVCDSHDFADGDYVARATTSGSSAARHPGSIEFRFRLRRE